MKGLHFTEAYQV